jgi:hypothetical protein
MSDYIPDPVADMALGEFPPLPLSPTTTLSTDGGVALPDDSADADADAEYDSDATLNHQADPTPREVSRFSWTSSEADSADEEAVTDPAPITLQIPDPTNFNLYWAAQTALPMSPAAPAAVIVISSDDDSDGGAPNQSVGSLFPTLPPLNFLADLAIPTLTLPSPLLSVSSNSNSGDDGNSQASYHSDADDESYSGEEDGEEDSDDEELFMYDDPGHGLQYMLRDADDFLW